MVVDQNMQDDQNKKVDRALKIPGVYVQQNGSLIPMRGGIYRPTKDSKIRSVEDIENLPWTKDQIIDAYMFRMCDEFVRLPSTDWETKRKAIFAMIWFSYGYIGPISDEIIEGILMSNPYDEDDNGCVIKMWHYGSSIDPNMPPPMDICGEGDDLEAQC